MNTLHATAPEGQLQFHACLSQPQHNTPTRLQYTSIFSVSHASNIIYLLLPQLLLLALLWRVAPAFRCPPHPSTLVAATTTNNLIFLSQHRFVFLFLIFFYCYCNLTLLGLQSGLLQNSTSIGLSFWFINYCSLL